MSSRDGTALPPPSERLYSCTYDFIARNSSELSVQQGETVEVRSHGQKAVTWVFSSGKAQVSRFSSQVLESSKRWWKCRNRFEQIGFVPSNILGPVEHVESSSPVTSRPPSVRHAHTHTRTSSPEPEFPRHSPSPPVTPAGSCSSAAPQDVFHGDTQSALPVATAPAQLTAVQPTRTGSGGDRK